MKKKKLSLQKITVANLNTETKRSIRGGHTGMVECSIPTPDSGCPEICTDGGNPTGSCVSGQPTCELFCTTQTPLTCEPCLP